MPYQVNTDADEGEPATRRSSSCTACRRSTTRRPTLGKQIAETYGLSNGLEVTDEVFESEMQHRVRAGREPHAHDQGDPRRDAGRLTMLVVIALGGNALLRRGEPMTAENQRRNVRIAAQGAGAGRRSSIRLVDRATATDRRSACSRCRAPRTPKVEDVSARRARRARPKG